MSYDGCSWNYDHLSLTWLVVQIILFIPICYYYVFLEIIAETILLQSWEIYNNLWNGENCELSPLQK